MRVFPVNRGEWFGLVVFAFKAYLPLGILCFLIWKVFTEGHRVRGGLAEAATPVGVGYLICTVIFLLAAVLLFVTRRRELVAETLLFAGIAFIIAYSLGLWCAA